MSDDAKLTRRQILSFWRREPTATTPVEPRAPSRERAGSGRTEGAFSIDAFYENRSQAGISPSTIPTFRLRSGLAPVATTPVGTPELGTPAFVDAAMTPPEATRFGVEPSARAFVGRLSIQRGRCLAWQGSFCTICSERCPEPGAIRLEGGRPVVNDARCTHCGICVAVCPAPINAFEIIATGGEPGAA
jgi:Pyruvate/2-oxoacid:ferredoxin oxidoreductase delta subunit